MAANNGRARSPARPEPTPDQRATALQAELDDVRHEMRSAVERALAVSAGELAQLKSTIVALRDTLEQAQHEKHEAVQHAIASSAHEIVQLKETAAALR